MSEQSPYEKLGITADASFEEVQTARDRLLATSAGETQRTAIESAYDAVLMERLRLRQEGKIKVPELIRFPERPSESLPKLPMVPTAGAAVWKNWWHGLRDTPEQRELIWSTGVFGVLSALSVLPKAAASASGVLQLCLALGLGYSLYALNRKEKRFGRACLLSVIGLLVGLIMGSAVASTVHGVLPSIGLSDDQATTVFTFVVLWLITSFLR